MIQLGVYLPFPLKSLLNPGKSLISISKSIENSILKSLKDLLKNSLKDSLKESFDKAIKHTGLPYSENYIQNLL